jgi:hypothetical protein
MLVIPFNIIDLAVPAVIPDIGDNHVPLIRALQIQNQEEEGK